MTESFSIDAALLKYLENKYNLKEDSELYKAAVILLKRLWQGSICISIDELKTEIPDFSEKIIDDSHAAGKCNELRPLIFDGKNLYIQKYYVYQSLIIEKIIKLAENGKFHIITGGPGTGKTTSLAKELANSANIESKILLAAPTGKAAFRMNQALINSTEYNIEKKHTHWVNDINKDFIDKLRKLEAKTIHRLLGSIHLSVNFRRNNENPLDADIIAIDECSMIDIPLMAKLLDAVPDNCRLFLLGDKNQLSPIEAGTVFADICEKYKENKNIVTMLTEVHRTESADILTFSKYVLDGNKEIIKNNLKNKVNFNETLSINELYSCCGSLLKAENPEDAIESLKKFQILCATKKGRNGTININKELMSIAKKDGALFTPVIITENNYTQNLFNGDVGVIDKEMAYFPGDKELRKFPLASLSAYDHAFAITIHKSQGSEYDKVAVVYPDSKKQEEDDGEQTIFTRELLYTAVTRAKNECIIYGSQDVLLESCERKVYRASGIGSRF